MKNIVFKAATLSLLFILSNTVVSATQVDTIRLTLDEAIRVALNENPTIKIADQEITKKGYAEKGSYAALLPQLDFTTNYQRTIQKQKMVIGEQRIEVGQKNVITPGFSASLPLVAPTLWTSLKVSAKDVELAVESARGSRIDLIEQVTKAFYTALLAKDSYVVIKENYDNALTNYQDIKQKFEAGLTSEYDMLRSSVATKNVEPELYDAQNSLVLTRWQLKALMGVDLDLPITCEGSLSDYEYLLAGGELILDRSLQDNSELKQLDIQEEKLKRILKMKKMEFMPTLSMTTNYQWVGMSNNFSFPWNPYSVAGFTLKVPLFSGTKRYNDMRQAKVDISKLTLQKENAERNLNVSLLSYTNSMMTNIKQYITAQSGIEEAQKGYDISTKRYELGSGTFLDINDSRLALTRAQLNLTQSIYNYMVARASIEKIYGTNENNEKK